MFLYFSLIFVVSLFCLGLRAITDEGMIGYPVRKYFQVHLPNFGKPVVLCATCMSSVWGTLIYWGHHAQTSDCLSVSSVAMWAGVVFSAAFINSLCWAYYERINTCLIR
jgi:hypothetical protein